MFFVILGGSIITGASTIGREIVTGGLGGGTTLVLMVGGASSMGRGWAMTGALRAGRKGVEVTGPTLPA